MTVFRRLILLAVLGTFGGALGGCGGGALNDFDPSSWLDFLDTKKKLPGERRAVFPEGVPGVDQGIPPDMYKGAHAQPAPVPQVEAAPVQEQPAPRGRSRSSSAAPVEAAPEADAAAPPPRAKRTAHRRSITAPPREESDTTQSQPTSSSQQQGQNSSSFPAPLPSGSFQR